MKTIGGMANRQIARDLKVAPETVNRHISRLGRHCLLWHAKLMEHAPPAINKDMGHLLETALGSSARARIYSDDHPGYRRPIGRLKGEVEHLVTPGR